MRGRDVFTGQLWHRSRGRSRRVERKTLQLNETGQRPFFAEKIFRKDGKSLQRGKY